MLVFLMVLTGGFVAGIRAGFAYNTVPLMNGAWIPPEILMLEPTWTNFFWNMATVQFDHRVGAWLLFLLVPVLWWKLRTANGVPARAEKGGNALLAMLAIQIALGIATLLRQTMLLFVPLLLGWLVWQARRRVGWRGPLVALAMLAALPQAGAVVVFGLAVSIAPAMR